ncbi:GAF domain-containing protein [Actinomycetospora sp. C-140]
MTVDNLVAHLRRSGTGLNDVTLVRDHEPALVRIVAAALVAVPVAAFAGLSPADGRYRSACPSVVGPLDALQAELGEGPAMTVLSRAPTDGVVAVHDFAGGDRHRWPAFSARALDAGCRSMLSILLEVDGVPRAALNLYGRGPHMFGVQARRAGGLFAVSAGMLLMAAEQAGRPTGTAPWVAEHCGVTDAP